MDLSKDFSDKLESKTNQNNLVKANHLNRAIIT